MGFVKDFLYRLSNKKWLRFFRSQSVCASYHLVNDVKREHIKYLYRYKNIDRFREDIDVLLCNYKSCGMDELLSRSRFDGFVLTFDDGLSEIYTTVYPILKEKGVSAIFFINPDFVDNHKAMYKHRLSIVLSYLERHSFVEEMLLRIGELCDIRFKSIEDFKKKFLSLKHTKEEKIDAVFKLLQIDEQEYVLQQQLYVTKAQIREMIANGFYFGGHTMSHRPLNELTFEEQKKEIIDSVQWLKDNFGITYSFFAFPFTDKGVSKRLIQELFAHNENLVLFGNSGLRKDIDARIVQRISLEDPCKSAERTLVMENLYKYFHLLTGGCKIKRN